jgi:uncharacterized phiE125 gp8 family phage protein
MKIRVKTEPTTEPIELTDAKEELRIDGTFSDAMVTSLIKAGRQAAEDYTNKSIAVQTLELALDYYPPDVLDLPKGPIISVDAITLTDMSGVTSSVDLSNYIVDTFGGHLVRKTGATYAGISLQETNGFIVEYTAGFEAVPEPIKRAILLYMRGQYDGIPPSDWIPSFERLLFPYKVVTV